MIMIELTSGNLKTKVQQWINNIKCLFFEKTNLSETTVVSYQFKRQKAQISNIRNEVENKIASATEIKRIIKGNYDQIYAIKL